MRLTRIAACFLMLGGVFIAEMAEGADGRPRRIVSVNITSDEILLALAPDRLVAVSVLADDPEVSNVVRDAKVIPTRVGPEIERILDLRPDLVVIGGHNLHVAGRLEALGIRVIRIQGFESIEWIERLIRMLGDAVGVSARAEQLIADMRGRLDAVARRLASRARPKVLTYSAGGGTQGRATTIDDVIRAAGAENIAATLGISGWKRLSLEQVLVADPDAIIISESQKWVRDFPSKFLAHPALRGLRAFEEGRIHQLPARLMITSSHHIVETVEALARALHPDAFAQAR